MSGQDQGRQDQTGKDQPKKVYNRPSLSLYGSLKELTHGGSGTKIEMGMGMGMGMGQDPKERP